MPARQSPTVVAARLLAWLRERSTIADDATPIDELVERLGILTATFDARMYPDTLGYLEPGEDLIFLCAGLPETVRRFTLAHELGHVALHRRAGSAAEIGAAGEDWGDESELSGCDDHDLDALTGDDETLRPGQAYSARAQREGEANAFAAALLMPLAATRAAYEEICARDAERPALALAQRFGVSEDVALRRLTHMLTQRDDEADAATQPSVSTLPARLDADQRRAARARTPALIVAGPGSGKTSALLARIAYLIKERGVAPDRILALTFSRKAARELSDRVSNALITSSAAPRVSTIHAFCGDTLRQYGPLVGLRPDYRLVTEVEGYFLLRALVNRAPLIHYTPLSWPTMHFRDMLGAISRAKDDLMMPEHCLSAARTLAQSASTPDEHIEAERALELATLYGAYQASLEERGDVDYGDLVAKMVQLLRSAPDAAAAIRGRYDHILVDEFQDINVAMGALLRELAGKRGALWAVGDADQAIYRFRGAAPANMRRFTRDFDGAQVIPLGRNYRSHPQILRAASAFADAFLPNEERGALRSTRGQSGGARVVTLATAPDSEAELDGLARMMRERAAAGIPLRQQATLLRTRDRVKQVCEGLRARGIPAQVATPLLDQPLIKSLLATVSLAHDPVAIGLLRAGDQPDHAFSDADARAALHLAHEYAVAPLESVRLELAPASLSAEGAAGLRRLQRIITELRAAPSVAVGLGRYIFSLTSLGLRLLRDDARAEAAQVARLLDICRTFDDQRAAGALHGVGDAAPGTANWSGLSDYVDALRLLGTETGGPVLGPEADAALVMTAHAAKGLEFPVVYLPQLATTRFPLAAKRSAIRLPSAQPGAEPTANGASEDATDEANLFYVSLTRARDELILSRARRYGKQSHNPSPYLAPIEEALGDELTRLSWDAAPDDAATTTDGEALDAEIDSPAPHSGGVADAPRVVALSHLEAYQLCPQRFAYQYVYGLQPPVAMSVSLHTAYKRMSGELREQFAQDAGPSLEETLAKFEERWIDARVEARRGANGATPDVREEKLAGVYLLHGRRAIERMWRMLQRGDSPLLAEDAGELSGGATVVVSVPLAGATVTGTLDHVERVERAERADREPASRASAQPVGRIARYKSGKADSAADVRDLFYVVAAEEMTRAGQTVTTVRASLTSGQVEPLEIKAKKRQNLERSVRAAIDGIAREDYTPQPDSRKCADCPFALICPA